MINNLIYSTYQEDMFGQICSATTNSTNYQYMKDMSLKLFTFNLLNIHTIKTI